MSQGVGFTVFQVPGAKTFKRRPGLASTESARNLAEPYVSGASSNSSSSFTGQSRSQRNSSTTFAAFQPPGGLQPVSSQSFTNNPSLSVPYAGTSGSIGSQSSTCSNPATGPGPTSIASKTDENQSRGGANWMRTGRIIRIKDSGDSFRFPLDVDHMPSTNVSAEEFEALKIQLQALAEKHLNSSATWLNNPSESPQYLHQSWKLHLEKKNCVIYRLKEAADASNLQRKTFLRAKIDTSLEELQFAINSSSTEDQRAYMAHCYQDSFLDAAVLQVHEKASPDDPFQFLGIKWFAYQNSVDSIFSCRDSLVVEFSKTMIDTNGQKVLVKVMQSIKMEECGGNERNFGFTRTYGTWVWLFRSLGASSGKVDVSVIAEDRFDGSRSTPSWFANRIVSTMYTVVSHQATAADAKYLVQSRMITDKPWVPNNERPACSVCFKSFNLLRSRHHCRVCAEIMCGACTIELGIQASKLPAGMLPETGSGFIVCVEKFCLKCINKARQERRSAHAAKLARGDRDVDESCDTSVPSSYALRASEVFYGQVPPVLASLSDQTVDRDVTAQQTYSFASSSSSTSSIGGTGSTNGEKSGISYSGWSTKVLSAINREKGAESKDFLTSHTRNLDNGASIPRTKRRGSIDRRRHNSDASSNSASVCEHVSNSNTDSQNCRDISAGEIVLLEEPDDVENITPLPTSFTKMEEQIAAQQALLRSMFIEGKKMMEQQAYGSSSHQRRYIDQMPKSVEETSVIVPSTSATIEYID